MLSHSIIQTWLLMCTPREKANQPFKTFPLCLRAHSLNIVKHIYLTHTHGGGGGGGGRMGGRDRQRQGQRDRQ